MGRTSRVPPRLAVVPELDAELNRLYGLPLEEFTPARNELATRLRQAGQGEAAERVRALRKPSVAVWTVNQLARRHPDDVEELLDAGKRLREAQGAALRRKGADTVREATSAERGALRKVTQRAERLLEDEGRPASSAARPTKPRPRPPLRATRPIAPARKRMRRRTSCATHKPPHSRGNAPHGR